MSEEADVEFFLSYVKGVVNYLGLAVHDVHWFFPQPIDDLDVMYRPSWEVISNDLFHVGGRLAFSKWDREMLGTKRQLTEKALRLMAKHSIFDALVCERDDRRFLVRAQKFYRPGHSFLYCYLADIYRNWRWEQHHRRLKWKTTPALWKIRLERRLQCLKKKIW